MRLVNARSAIAAVAIGGFAAGTVLIGAGSASADVMDDVLPLLVSTCSFSQIDAALHDAAPDAAARLDASPLQKSVLRFTFNQPADKRQAMFGPLAEKRLRLGAATGDQQGAGAVNPKADTELRKVVDTCHNYGSTS
ncbi:hemophore-related protein [Nocardia alni]|uniref:hemophore-related protein n=1 Tax=Nocardia alni TaxID=2815723 RepID=UPI001C240DD1|nr:hemophore-related protein [Nocardia alni]